MSKMTKRELTIFIFMIVVCMLVSLGMCIYTVFNYKENESERLLIAKNNMVEFEEILKNTPTEKEKQKAIVMEQEERLGVKLEDSGVETMVVDREELEKIIEEGQIAFDKTTEKEVLTKQDIQTFYVTMTNYLYAGNIKEAGKLSNRLQAKYDLNEVEDSNFQNLVLDINYLYATRDLPASNITDFIKTPEVLSYLFMQQDFEDQYKLIKEKRSPVVKKYQTFNVISITEVNPRHYGADFYFSGVYRFKGYEFKFSTSDGIFMIYTVRDQNNKMHILATGSEKEATTYQELYDLYYEGR